MPQSTEPLESVKAQFDQSVGSLPENQQVILLKRFNAEIKAFVNPTPYPFDILQKTYIPYALPVKQSTIDSIWAHLEQHLSDYLTFFGAEEDHVYLDQFRKIEPQTSNIYDKFRYEHKKDASIPLFTEVVPKKSSRITKKINDFGLSEPDKKRALTNLYTAMRRRSL